MWSPGIFFFFFQMGGKDRQKEIDTLKTPPQCSLSHLANFPEETVQLENGQIPLGSVLS